MSQAATRKVINDDKRQSDSPTKEKDKKKIPSVTEKDAKVPEKHVEKVVKPDEKNGQATDKKTDKKVEKKEGQSSKDDGKVEKNVKSNGTDKPEENPKKTDSKNAKQNGKETNGVHNGVSDVTLNANGTTDNTLQPTVSGDSDDEEILVIDDQDQDELFPELTYDDTSDVESFEPPTPEGVPSRSVTRRSQLKAARTPETPRPASDKQANVEKETEKKNGDEASKILKLKDDAAERKLRSTNSPKPEGKKQQVVKPNSAVVETTSKPSIERIVEVTVEKLKPTEKVDDKISDVVIDLEGEGQDEVRKTDTNFSKSRVKVSPYRRSMRLADQTHSSIMANYTGNNTMEMDITTETSSFACEDPSLDDSTYLSGLKNIKSRRSYKKLGELVIKRQANISATSETVRPTVTVIGRKRKPEPEPSPDRSEANSSRFEIATEAVESKRMRLFDRIAQPFRRTLTGAARRNAEIVGINTDLPLTSPAVPVESMDPESIKNINIAVNSETAKHQSMSPMSADKRCIVM